MAVAARATRIPVASRRLWIGAASYTLAAAMAAAAGGSVRLEGASGWVERLALEGVDAGSAAAALLGALRGLSGRAEKEPPRVEACGFEAENTWPRDRPVRGVPGFNARYDPAYFEAIASRLCGAPSKPVGEWSLADLALATARSLCDCPSALEETEPLVLARAEFYRFSRTLGGPRTTGRDFDVAKTLSLPALSQALGLLAHYATGVARGVNLALVEEAVLHGSPRRAVEFYALARSWVGGLYAAYQGEEPTTEMIVLTVGAAAARLSLAGSGVDPNAVVLARFTYGMRTTLQWASPIPAANAAAVIAETVKAAYGGRPERVEELASSLTGLAGAPVRGLPEEDAQRARAARRAAEEYARYMEAYASSLAAGDPDYSAAYAAVRAMRAAEYTLAGARSAALQGLARAARYLADFASHAILLKPELVARVTL